MTIERELVESPTSEAARDVRTCFVATITGRRAEPAARRDPGSP